MVRRITEKRSPTAGTECRPPLWWEELHSYNFAEVSQSDPQKSGLSLQHIPRCSAELMVKIKGTKKA